MFSRSINNMHKGLVFNFNILKVFFKWKLNLYTMIISLFRCGVYSGSIWERMLFNCRETVEKIFRIVEWNFKASLQNICKLVCSYIHNLLVMHFRCLPMSCALHVMFVDKTIRVMWKWFETFLHVLIILIWVGFWENIFGEFFIIKHQSTKHQRKTSMLQIAQNCFAAGKQKEIFWIIKCASTFETVTDWQKVQYVIHVIFEYICG